jgi:Mn-dependent DtxR family transcriptional regulator
MANEKNNGTVPVVEEIGNWITTKKAAELMGVELTSVGAIIHSGRVKACRIAGVFLVDKSSATEFGKHREAQALAELARKSRSERLAKLSEMTDEQLEQLLSKVEAGDS